MKKRQNSTREFDLDKFLPYLLNQAAEITSQEFQAVYRAEYGMTRTQWRAMANLGKYGMLTAAEICKHTFIEKTKMSRAVQALEVKGFLKRVAIVGDRRSERLVLTPNGVIAFQALGKKAMAFDLNVRDRLGQERANSLEKVLRILLQAGLAAF
jgi:DNA-binding MarR family transcriptional regulator